MSSTVTKIRTFNFGKNMDELNKESKFCSNFVKTSKYNMFTFLPLALIL